MLFIYTLFVLKNIYIYMYIKIYIYIYIFKSMYTLVFRGNSSWSSKCELFDVLSDLKDARWN